MTKEEAKKIFGANLRRIRIAKGITQEEFAHKLGYSSRSSINKVEAGDRDIPRSKVELAAKILGVSPIELFRNDPISEVDFVHEEVPSVIEMSKLTDINKAKLEAYYQALLDSQGGE